MKYVTNYILTLFKKRTNLKSASRQNGLKKDEKIRYESELTYPIWLIQNFIGTDWNCQQ